MEQQILQNQLANVTKQASPIIIDILHLEATMRLTERYYVPSATSFQELMSQLENDIFITPKKTIEIVTVMVDQKHQKKGNCTRFLQALESIASSQSRAIYVECVMSKQLESILLKRNYIKQDYNFWKFV